MVKKRIPIGTKRHMLSWKKKRKRLEVPFMTKCLNTFSDDKGRVTLVKKRMPIGTKSQVFYWQRTKTPKFSFYDDVLRDTLKVVHRYTSGMSWRRVSTHDKEDDIGQKENVDNVDAF